MQSFTCKVDNQGRVTLPSEWRKAHRVRSGSEVLLTVAGEQLQVQTIEQTLDEAQQIVAAHSRRSRSAVAQLRAERLREARREQKDAARHAKGL